ncbi:hypothetical protein PENTCL1PPCAC_21035, partial [Pristionchus entomophagus]
QRRDFKQDPTWTPPAPTTRNLPSFEYLVVSKESLLSLLRKCTNCRTGENHLSFRMEGMAVTCTGECNSCPHKFTWGNIKVLNTSKCSNMERLPKINVDITYGAVITSIGGTKLHQICSLVGISPLSNNTFHRIKKLYVSPAIAETFWKMQGKVIDALRERIEKGGKLHIAGDGSFDSRGYSGKYCRYFFLDAENNNVRARMVETPDTTERKRKAALAQKRREIDRLTRPLVPSAADPNLEEEWSSDEEGEEETGEDEEEDEE